MLSQSKGPVLYWFANTIASNFLECVEEAVVCGLPGSEPTRIRYLMPITKWHLTGGQTRGVMLQGQKTCVVHTEATCSGDKITTCALTSKCCDYMSQGCFQSSEEFSLCKSIKLKPLSC